MLVWLSLCQDIKVRDIRDLIILKLDKYNGAKEYCKLGDATDIGVTLRGNLGNLR